MKSILKYRIWMALLAAPILIAIGAYNVAMGNTAYARPWFLWGLVSLMAGLMGLLLAKRISK